MNAEKQQLLIEYLISSPDIFALTTSIISPEFFDPEYKNSVKFIQKYYQNYNALPTVDQIFAEVGIKYTKRKLTKDSIQYCIDEIETFCRARSMQLAILKAAKLSSTKGDEASGEIEELVKDALNLSIHTSIGMGLFDDPEGMMQLLRENPSFSTGYKEFDEALGGGLRRQQMLLLTANSGGGKSVVLANLGLNFAEQGLKVLYISLELSVSLIHMRYTSMITGISSKELVDRSDEAIIKLKNAQAELNGGCIYIEQMPVGTSASKVRSFLKEFELKRGFLPDVLLLDYLDLAGPNETSAYDQVFEKDKKTSEQFRQVLVDYDMIGATASQQNRSAIGSNDINQSHIAGGLSKINTTDNCASIIRNEMMQAQGVVALLLTKTRNSDGKDKLIFLTWNGVSLRITDKPAKESENLIANFRKMKQLPDTSPSTPGNYPGKQNSSKKSSLMTMFGDFDDLDTGA